MANKVYEKNKNLKKKIFKIIKQNYGIIIFDIIIVALLVVPTGYSVYSSGGLLDISKRVEIENGYDSEGSINSTYVTSRNATIALYGLSHIIRDWDLKKKSDLTIKDEEYNELVERQKIAYKEAMNHAIINAFDEANNKYKMKNKKVIVLAVMNDKTNIKVGDEIVKVNNKKVNGTEDLEKIIRDKKDGDKVKVVYKRNKKKITEEVNLKESKERTVVGLYLTEMYDIVTKPEVKLKFKDSESGPSSGFMTSLYIYNSLTEIDITKGLKLSGTGTIDEKGKVGSIDGVKYKIKGAVKKDADVFLVPKDNYKEALKIKNKYKYNITLIKVTTFKEALKQLEDL